MITTDTQEEEEETTKAKIDKEMEFLSIERIATSVSSIEDMIGTTVPSIPKVLATDGTGTEIAKIATKIEDQKTN